MGRWKQFLRLVVVPAMVGIFRYTRLPRYSPFQTAILQSGVVGVSMPPRGKRGTSIEQPRSSCQHPDRRLLTPTGTGYPL